MTRMILTLSELVIFKSCVTVQSHMEINRIKLTSYLLKI